MINPEARGHGDSDWAPDGTYTLAALADDLRAVIAILPSPPALIGASMGGATALYLLGNHPTALASALVMVDIVPRIESAGGHNIGQFMRANPQGFASRAISSATLAWKNSAHTCRNSKYSTCGMPATWWPATVTMRSTTRWWNS
ncbi:MAG: alpha/beta fold hydrolase [Panacagrimonas sp.]